MAVAANADDYAAARLNIFFPGVTSDLDGQCVSLEKWFLGEMAGVPNWNAARGNANTCGRTLVAQGLADEVPYAQRRRGDVVCLEYGQYGHVYIQLSGGRVFEENVNWPGVSSEIIDGDRVYASRIGSDQEAWRIAAGKNPHVYRLRGYSEGGGGTGVKDVMDSNDGLEFYWFGLHRRPGQVSDGERDARNGMKFSDAANPARQSAEWQDQDRKIFGYDGVVAQLTAAQQALADLGSRPTQAQLDAASKAASDAQAALAKDQAEKAEIQAKYDALDAQATSDTTAGDSFLRRLGQFISKYLGGK